MPYSLRTLLRQIRHLSWTHQPMTMAKCISTDVAPATERVLLLRLDVERRIEHARCVAESLWEMSVRATFFVHSRPETFQPEMLRRIAGLGHEVGLHHECLDYTRGDFSAARGRFLRECDQFRAVGIDLKTVCGHAELGIHRRGYANNWELFERYPHLLEEAGVVEAQHYFHKRFDGHIRSASDLLKDYPKLWHCLSEYREYPGIVHLLIHPHRWGTLSTASVQVGLDLWHAAQNRITGHRLYHA